MYFKVLDCLTGRLKYRFSETSFFMANVVDGLFCLDFEKATPFARNYVQYLKVDETLLKAEISSSSVC